MCLLLSAQTRLFIGFDIDFKTFLTLCLKFKKHVCITVTFGPGGPQEPRMPSCPEHLHVTLQHSLSDTASCRDTQTISSFSHFFLMALFFKKNQTTWTVIQHATQENCFTHNWLTVFVIILSCLCSFVVYFHSFLCLCTTLSCLCTVLLSHLNQPQNWRRFNPTSWSAKCTVV